MLNTHASPEPADARLLRDYVARGAESAFAEIVARNAGLVYAAALRQASSPETAREMAQSVFTDLARKAGELAPRLGPDASLAGWLYQGVRYAALNFRREESRRADREQIVMQHLQTAAAPAPADGPNWQAIAPVLDEAMADLNAADREAVLLRYFQNLDFAAVGRALGISDDAAQKRVSRAVERLRDLLQKRGVTAGGSGLVILISANAVLVAPLELSAAIVATALAGTTLTTATTATAGKAIAMTKPQRSLTSVTIAVLGIAVVALLVMQSSFKDRQGPKSSAQQSAPTNAEAKPAVMTSPFARRSPNMAVTVEMPESIRLKFRILDATTGQGLAGGRIRAGYFYVGGCSEPYELITDGNGDATIPRAQEGGDPGMNVFACVEGFVPKAVGWGQNAPREYVLRLEPAAMAGGFVLDEQGIPVAGVKLEASRSEKYTNGSPNTDFQITNVETDANGRWSYHYIPKSYTEVSFDLTLKGYAVTRAVVQMNPLESMSARLVIKRGSAVVGRVTDTQGTPLVGAFLKELHDFGSRRWSTETDRNGEFSLFGFNTNYGSRVEIAVQAQGMAPQLQVIELREPTNTVQFALLKGNIFRGRVLDEMGNPISKAAVRTDDDFKNQVRARFEWSTETDADGRFVWNSAPAETICYWFEAVGYEVIRGLPLSADGNEHQITLKTK